MLLSVIIPTRNRAKKLSIALESITAQTLQPELFEVIVVDNGSTDNTKEVVQRFSKKIKWLRYFYETTPGLHIGRHRGSAEADADILVYTDDDIEAFQSWMEGIVEAFEDESVVLVGGRILPKFETEPPNWLMWMWENDCSEGRMLSYLSILDLGEIIREISPYYVFGCNFSIRKFVLLEAGGFHPDAMPHELIRFRGDGETHVARYVAEKGYKAVYHPKASLYHLVNKERMTESYFCKRAYNQGISDSFARVRVGKGLVDVPSLNPKSKGLYERLVQMSSGDIVRAIGRRANRIIGRSRKEPYAEIRSKIAKAYRAGWQFHQNEVKNDSTLLEYVLRQTYLE